jgi:flagellar biosynthesis protein FliQ
MPLYLQLLHTALAAELAALVPIVLLLLIVGLLTAIFQAAFQIEDTAFSLLPKTIAMLAIPLLGGLAAMHSFEALSSYWIGHAAVLVRRPWS